MKKVLYVISIFLVTAILLKCSNNNKNQAIAINLKNDGNTQFDSILLYLNFYKQKILRSNKKIVLTVDRNSIKLNSHDVSIRAQLWLNGSNLTKNDLLYYSDLRSSFDKDYTLVITSDTLIHLLNK